jgi:monoamine oxidase
MTSIRTYVTILLQDLLAWLHQKLSRWLLGGVNTRLHLLERDDHAKSLRIDALEEKLQIACESLEKQRIGTNSSIATAFARDNERICALEESAQTAKSTLTGIALELAGIKAKMATPTMPTPKAVAAVVAEIQKAAKRKPTKTRKAQ